MKILLTCFLSIAIAMSAVAQEPLAQSREDFSKAVLFGKRFFERNDYSSSLEQFAKADAIFPDQSSVLYNTALVLTRLGRFTDAQARIDRYNQLFSKGPEAPMVAKLLLELDFEREVEKKQQANHDYVELFNRGKFLLQKGETENALKVFEQAEQQKPTDAAVVYNEALAYEQLGDFGKATDHYRRYLELNQSAGDKSLIDQKLFTLQNENEDMRSKIVCSFCGYKLPAGATWCPRCWHGPYLVNTGRWNSRPCGNGATATRSTYYLDGRLAKNEDLPCLLRGGNFLESLRYSPLKQRAIQTARRNEGWSYQGDVLSDKTSKDVTEIRLDQNDYLEHLLALTTGEVLRFNAHKTGERVWLLDREDLLIDSQKYTKTYAYDSSGRISQEKVSYLDGFGCDHVIEVTADYAYANEELTTVRFHGGYVGYQNEGSPDTRWDATLAFTYDSAARVEKEEFAVTSFTKTFATKPSSATRDLIEKLYPTMRVKKPLDVMRIGDLCSIAGSIYIGNRIDLRPFYSISPSIATVLSFGVTKMTVAFTYPEGFKYR
ncbi:MAG TPA: tetratricopeptide repeat protein [Thermoanaerobaculia bacterium]|nr:tetratricopeptide repeat protein [Thermoanaerobaculia bacterium]